MDEVQISRVMPNSLSAERSVIGSMMMDKDAITEVMEILTPDDFYNAPFNTMYEVLLALYEEGKSGDLVILQDRLKQKNLPGQFTDPVYLADILDGVSVSVNAAEHARIVKEKSLLRQVIRTNQEIENTCFKGEDTSDAILDETERRLNDLIKNKGVEDDVPIHIVVQNALSAIEAASKQKGKITGIPTGFIDLDYKMAGLQPSDLILLAARPSMGKTALALNIAQYVAFHDHHCVAIFSLEMSKEQLVNRLFSLESKVDAQKLRTGSLQESEWEQLVEGASNIARSNLIIDDTSGISVAQLRSKCRKYSREKDLKLVIIDYLQLMTGSGKNESRQQEISDISRSLKGLARELNVPVIALSQLNRGVEQREDKRPMLSDLRDSGAIEQDADVVMFIYRDDYYNKDSDRKGISEVIIAKQRNGPIGTVDLVWLPEYTMFKNREKEHKKKD